MEDGRSPWSAAMLWPQHMATSDQDHRHGNRVAAVIPGAAQAELMESYGNNVHVQKP